jgi:integrase
MKYRSRLDIGKIIEAANESLRSRDPECHAIFPLAVAAGLRRKEIDLLEWTSFLWEENMIRIQHTPTSSIQNLRIRLPKSKSITSDGDLSRVPYHGQRTSTSPTTMPE